MTQADADDLAIQVGTALDVLGGDLEGIFGGTPVAATAPARVRPARALADTTYTSQGLTYDATRVYYDGMDNPLPGYGPTAARMSWGSRATGTLMGDRDTAAVSHAGILEVGGLQAGEDTLRLVGSAIDTLFIRFRSLDDAGLRYFHWTSGLVINDVRILKSDLQTGLAPLSGRITFIVSADRLRSYTLGDVETHIETFVVITFDGTGVADLVVEGTFRYRWNIATGEVVRA